MDAPISAYVSEKDSNDKNCFVKLQFVDSETNNTKDVYIAKFLQGTSIEGGYFLPTDDINSIKNKIKSLFHLDEILYIYKDNSESPIGFIGMVKEVNPNSQLAYSNYLFHNLDDSSKSRKGGCYVNDGNTKYIVLNDAGLNTKASIDVQVYYAYVNSIHFKAFLTSSFYSITNGCKLVLNGNKNFEFNQKVLPRQTKEVASIEEEQYIDLDYSVDKNDKKALNFYMEVYNTEGTYSRTVSPEFYVHNRRLKIWKSKYYKTLPLNDNEIISGEEKVLYMFEDEYYKLVYLPCLINGSPSYDNKIESAFVPGALEEWVYVPEELRENSKSFHAYSDGYLNVFNHPNTTEATNVINHFPSGFFKSDWKIKTPDNKIKNIYMHIGNDGSFLEYSILNWESTVNPNPEPVEPHVNIAIKVDFGQPFEDIPKYRNRINVNITKKDLGDIPIKVSFSIHCYSKASNEQYYEISFLDPNDPNLIDQKTINITNATLSASEREKTYVFYCTDRNNTNTDGIVLGQNAKAIDANTNNSIKTYANTDPIIF